MAAAALPVVLKKFRRKLSDILRIEAAKISKGFQFIGLLDDSGCLFLCSILSEEQDCLSDVKEFEWTQSSSAETSQSFDDKPFHLSFVAVKSDSSVELYSVYHGTDVSTQPSDNAADGIHINCIAAVTADLLKALLRDRGKECEVTCVKLLTCRQQNDYFGCSVTLLINRKLIATMSLSLDDSLELEQCFALDNLASSLPLLVPVTQLSQVQVCSDMVFSLFPAGPLIIHHIDGNFIGWVDIQDSAMLEEGPVNETELAAFQQRSTFCCFEVAEDLSVLILCDNKNTLYIVNLDEYFVRFPGHFCYSSSKSSSSSGGKSVFQYESLDEDVLLRDPRTASMSYGDRVWKTELAEVIQSVKEECLHHNTGTSCSVAAKSDSTDQFNYHWFDSIEGISSLQFFKTNQHKKKQSLDGRGCLTGFLAKQQKQNRNSSVSTMDPDEQGSVSYSVSRTITAAPWMNGYKVYELFGTGESVLLWLKPSKDRNDVDSGSDVAIPEFAHGMLCLFSFSSDEFSAHGFTEPTVVVRSTDTTHPQFMLTGGVLSVPAFGVTQDQLVHKVIMYENAAMADSLCHINRWDHCAIPIHALEVALKLRQLDTVAFFLKNQENVFSCQSVHPTSSPSPSFSPSQLALSPSSLLLPQGGLDTNQIEAVINLLVKAVKYNARQDHNRHFTSQLLQMTLSYLHGLMEDGAGVLEKQRAERNAVRPQKQIPSDAALVKPLPMSQDIERSMRFITMSIVELRQFLANMPSEEGVSREETYALSESAPGDMFPDYEQTKLFSSWRNKHDLDVIKDAIYSGKVSQAQLFFQHERKFREKHFLGTCDGTLTSVKSVGLKLMLNALVQQDMDTFITMVTNMGRDVNEQLRSICFYTLHRPLRDYLVRELETRSSLSEEEKIIAKFVHTLEMIYNLQSFDKAKQCLPRAIESDWNDLGLLRNSFNLSSNQVLKEFLHTGSLLLGQSYKESFQGGATGYVEVLLEWVRTWDVRARERILLEALFSGAVPSTLSSEVEVSARSLWHYLVSRNDWPKLVGWIRAMALDIDAPSISPVIHVGQRFAVREGDIIMPPITPDVYSQFPQCTKVLNEIVLDELTKHGMFTSEQLSNFTLLLHHLCRTQTLFGDNHPLEPLGSQSPYQERQLVSDLVAEDRDGARKKIISVSDFHISFIEYCVKLKLVNLLYHYMDFYRLGQSSSSIRELGLENTQPLWVDMLVKFRLAGLQSEEPGRIYNASLVNAGIVLQLNHPSVSAMLKAGRVIMALTTLMYGPGSLSQAIVPAGSPQEDPIWQVPEPLLREALGAHHKLQSALFPLTTSVDGMERQDITVYQLLQGNSPFEISRMFNWQSTNELAGKSGSASEMPHFSCPSLVQQFAHKEQLTFAYYLRHGRPSFAFTTFVGDHVNTRVIPKSRILAATKKAYRVALQNFNKARITCACVAFTEMMGVDSTCLRVDIQSANRILSHGGWEGLIDSDSRKESAAKEAIEYEFLTTRDRAVRPISLLKALEQATRNLISKECLDRTSLDASYHWSLVLMFCRAHKMDLSPVYLIDCAKANKWLPFICHAQSAQFPKHQVLEVVEHHFTNSHLKEHLHLALKNAQTVKVELDVNESERRRRRRKSIKRTELAVTPTRDVRAQFVSRVLRHPASSPEVASSYVAAVPTTQSSSAEDEESSKLKSKRGSDKDSGSAAEGKSTEPSERSLKTTETSRDESQEKPLDPDDLPDDLCDVLFACQSAKVPWRSLLAHALALHRPLLAVIAACYEESNPLDCLCAWLYSTLRPEVLESATQTITGTSSSDGTEKVLTSLQWRRWKLEDLAAIIEVAVSHREVYAHTLVKAFYIFNPDNPMLPFMRFFESFVVHYDFGSCREQLNAFKKGYNKAAVKGLGSDKKVTCDSMNDVVWLEKVTGQVTKVMVAESTTSYEQSHLLELLSKAMFGRNFFYKVPKYFKLNRIAEILRNTETEMSFKYMLEEDSPQAKQERGRVLESLLHYKRFSEARKLAGVLELPEDHITLKEVLHDYEIIQNSLLWEVQQGRLAFWFKADECFRNNVCNPDVAGSFFEERASEEQLSFKERAKLLSMALRWYSNKAGRKSGTPAKSPTELKQMERKIWFYKIRAEIEKDREATLSRSISHVDFLPDRSELAQDIPTASSSPVHSSFVSHSRADMARELVQPEAVDAEQDEDAILETEEEIKALEGVIDELLEHFHVSQARKLATLFGHSSQDLDIVLSCIFLAQGTRTVESLNENLEKLSRATQRKSSASGSAPSIKRSRSSGSFILSSSLDSSIGSESDAPEVDWVLIEDNLATMESLAYHAIKGKKCCSRVIICYKISQSLGARYQTVVQDDPFNVLRSLLVSVLDSRFKLAEAFIKAFSLDTERVTAFLAEIILHSLRVYTGEVSAGENFELIFNAAPSCDDISHVIRLCSDHSLLGTRLLENATTLQNVRASSVPQAVFQLEVELLVRAHDCHTLACNMEGISSVLKHGKLLTTALADARHYSLMVRLLTGVGRFHEMSYVFETLLKHHHFELLCRRGIDKENKLKVALLDYLKRYHPDDNEKYTMVAYHFSMYREIAENLESSAIAQLKTLKDYVIAATPELEAKLNSIMRSFCYACDNYAKDGCQRHSQKCLKQARLVQLQIQLLPSGVRVINLDDHGLQRFAAKHGHFFEALLVADAYGKRGYSIWVDAVYTHVVLGGDFKYFHDLKSAISLSSVLFVDVVNKYKNEGTRSSQITVNLRKLLNYVTEARIRYRLATDLNFRDVASSMLEGDGGSYLRDIMAP